MKKRILIDLIAIALFFLAVLAVNLVIVKRHYADLEQENKEIWCTLEELAVGKLQIGDLTFLMKQRMREVDYIEKFNKMAVPEKVKSKEEK